jgi:two-component system, response regulator / RNA-binding antiterminator
LRVLIVDESPDRAAILREALEGAGHEVAATLGSPLELLTEVERVHPDVIVIDIESPSRDVIEHLCVVTRDQPRPIVMFANDDDPSIIREALKAGIAAYVVDGLDAARVKPIVDVACARFDEFQRLRNELAEANLKLSERKLIDRAKVS